MPTPVELLLDPISLTLFAMYAGLMLWEAVAPGRPLPLLRGWRVRALSAFAVFFFVSSYLPLVIDTHLARFQLLDLTGLGTWGGALAGLLIYEAGTYVWHRSMHASDLLWQGVHQMHHSAERLDTFSAFWFGPLDMIGWTVLPSVCLVLLVGITPEAAVLDLYVITFLGIFQHTNVRTPQWLGYLVQRPESHSYHHARGLHARNYADLPVFDLLFGTLYNPRDFAPATGFYHGASERVLDMLRFRDVSKPVVATEATT